MTESKNVDRVLNTIIFNTINKVWKYFTPCFSVSVVNFEHVIASWVQAFFTSNAFFQFSLSVALVSFLSELQMLLRCHCVKSVQIPSFFWSVFNRIRTEWRDTLYLSVFSRNAGKYEAKKNSVFGHFSRSVLLSLHKHHHTETLIISLAYLCPA